MDPLLKLLELSDEAFFVPTVEIMGRKVGIDCLPGVVERVDDDSFTQTWNEHVGTDWASVPHYLGNNRWVRDEIYTHHYVERSQTVGRNKITIRLDERGDTNRTRHRKSWNIWFGSNVEFAPGDRVVLVAADIDTLVLVNETRRYQVFTGLTYRGEPEPEGAVHAFGRFLDRPLLAVGILLLLCLGAWKASAVLPALLCWAVPVLFAAAWSISIKSWDRSKADFRRKVRDACETALLRLEKVRAGVPIKKAHAETFGESSGLTATTAFKPWWVSVCELFGATALPPEESRQHYALMLEVMQENEARRSRGQSPEEKALAATAADAASREFGKAYVRHRGEVPMDILVEIARREKLAVRQPRPPRHVRRRGAGIFHDQWQIHWGKPAWPAELGVDKTEAMTRQFSWFSDALRNGTIPPLPVDPGDTRRFSPARSVGNDPAYPDAKLRLPNGKIFKAA